MSTLSPLEFVSKWQNPSLLQMNESQLAQTHFNDLCALVDHPDPVSFGNKEIFSFEAAHIKPDRSKGFADVFYRSRFIWEYKGIHANLDKAYQQLLLYKDALDNPPLLITCDIYKIIIHTNYTNTVKKIHVITFESLLQGAGLTQLKTIFNGSLSEIEAMFKPEQTREYITQTTADQFMQIVEGVRQHIEGEKLPFDNEEQAHFFIRLLFCLFAESIGLLPDKLFTQLIERSHQNVTNTQLFVKMLTDLFKAMREGQNFGFYPLPHFNGGLFDNDFVPPSLPTSLINDLLTACRYDWSQLEPSILGTLFERILDVTKRHQIGAHYTSKADIELLIKPVLMQPLIDEWEATKAEVLLQLRQAQPATAHTLLQNFADKVAALRILDPACGSGNFLYIALQHLLDLQKEVVVFAERHNLPPIPLTVGPQQLHGMEINVYAHELAQVTVWIGYIQWRYENGLAQLPNPILRPLNTIQRMDAILAYDDTGQPYEPDWVEVDVIIGNPPFLGNKRLRRELGDSYMESLSQIYQGRLENTSDLVCYWFEKARQQLAQGKAKRAGLVSTNAIRYIFNRGVLTAIKRTGDIFFAISDREWMLDGATVHISLIGFDTGQQKRRQLNGQKVDKIYANLTATVDTTQARPLSENRNFSFMGSTLVGNFTLPEKVALDLVAQTNASGANNADVIRPYRNCSDMVKRSRNLWIIDFDGLSLTEAERYEKPLAYVREHVKPQRDKNRDAQRRRKWWQLGRTITHMRAAFKPLTRYIATCNVSKHRIFYWLDVAILPDATLIVFAFDTDYHLGVLHSKLHQIWSLAVGTQLRDAASAARYTPTTCFETFPFPWPLGQEPLQHHLLQQIALATRQLVTFRDNWLNPPPDNLNFGPLTLEKRTLTHLYNALACYRQVKPPHENAWAAALSQVVPLGNISPKTFLPLADIETLHAIHQHLDRTVLAAYGGDPDFDDDDILQLLLALNAERAA